MCINVAITPIVYTLPMKQLPLITCLRSKLGSGGNKITISGTPTVSGTLHYKITAAGSVAAEGDLS
ncbi:hypothetical protein CS542_07840 [Pedobacter sp. IW39]|nr:hypothetical protein CS542_07840 [Pedobacter sp. IW39]